MVVLRGQGISLRELSRRFGGSTLSVRKALLRNGIGPLRTGRPKWRTFTVEQIADMAAMWNDGKSQRAIAVKYGTVQTIISAILKREGFTPEHRYNRARGADHGAWKGGRVRIGKYWAVMLFPGDPFWEMATTANGYVLEHRLVMARSLGRALTSRETVHHINGDHADNRLANLQLRQGKHGIGEAMRCYDCGSYNVGPAPLAAPPPGQLALRMDS